MISDVGSAVHVTERASVLSVLPSKGNSTARVSALAVRDPGGDVVEIESLAGPRIAGAAAEIREGLVRRIRQELAAGTYAIDEKLNAVIDRLHREVLG